MIDPSIAGHLRLFKDMVRQQWEDVREEDLEAFDGSRDRLIDVVQARYDERRSEAAREVDAFLGRISGLRA